MVDIAYQVGFNNLSNFNRVFKMIKGKTPSQHYKHTPDYQTESQNFAFKKA
jgi:AraC-like DNA-binding protein